MKRKPKPPVQYTSVNVTAKRWGVSRNRVDQLARTGHIPGALRSKDALGRVSILIPVDAVRPVSRQGQRNDLR